MSSQTKYKTVSTYTLMPSNDNCTVYISYFGGEKVDGIISETFYGGKYVMIRETENHYVIMGYFGKEIPLPKEDCKKTPWFI